MAPAHEKRYGRAMTQLSIAVPPALQQWVETRLAEGDYADAADYLRDLIRRDRDHANRAWLREMIDEGLASGVVPGDAEDVLAAIIAEDPDLRD